MLSLYIANEKTGIKIKTDLNHTTTKRQSWDAAQVTDSRAQPTETLFIVGDSMCMGVGRNHAKTE